MRGFFLRLYTALFQQVDAASVAVFRILYGGILLWEVWRYFDAGWIARYYTEKALYFTYPGFSWVHPWPTLEFMEAHFLFIALCGICIVFGLFYRAAAVGMFLSFSYVFLLEQARYLNHFYLVILIAWIMIFVPAHTTWSLDTWIAQRIGRTQSRFLRWIFPLDSAQKNDATISQWGLWILQFQLGVVYVYGGIAKITPDWLKGYPLKQWIQGADHVPFIGSFVHLEWMGLLLSYAGLLVDLFLVPLLLWRKTRWIAFGIAVLFHYFNDQLFHIGIFPWFMLAGTLLFFDPWWPRSCWEFVKNGYKGMMDIQKKHISAFRPMAVSSTRGRKIWVVLLCFYVALQLLIPFRHWLYPGVVHWTEEGHMFSWHMKLRSKVGEISFRLRHPSSGYVWTIAPESYLNSRQVRKMSTRPDMILQFAHFLRDEYRAQGYEDIEVYADSVASLNGRRFQPLVDPRVNLAKEQWSWEQWEWIVPLYEDLP